MIKVFSGKVIKKRPQTAVVEVIRTRRHPIYKKTLKISKKYHVHDPGNTAQIGAQVKFKPSKPYSKLKKFIMIK